MDTSISPAATAVCGGRHEDRSAQLHANLRTLLNIHTAKRRLLLAIGRRRRQGQPVNDLERELDTQRREAKALLSALS